MKLRDIGGGRWDGDELDVLRAARVSVCMDMHPSYHTIDTCHQHIMHHKAYLQCSFYNLIFPEIMCQNNGSGRSGPTTELQSSTFPLIVGLPLFPKQPRRLATSFPNAYLLRPYLQHCALIGHTIHHFAARSTHIARQVDHVSLLRQSHCSKGERRLFPR